MSNRRFPVIALAALALVALGSRDAHAAANYSYSGPNSASASVNVTLNNTTQRTASATITAGHTNSLLVVTSGISSYDSNTVGGVQYYCQVWANDALLDQVYSETPVGERFGNRAPFTAAKTIGVDLAAYGLASQPIDVSVTCAMYGPSSSSPVNTVNITLVAQTVPR